MPKARVASEGETSTLRADLLRSGWAVADGDETADLAVFQTDFHDEAEAARTIRELRASSRAVVVISSREGESHVRCAREAGAAAFLVSPYKLDELLAVLDVSLLR